MAPKLPQARFRNSRCGQGLRADRLPRADHRGLLRRLPHGPDRGDRSSAAQHDALEGQLNEAKQRQKEYLKLREEVSAREALDKQNLRILPVTAEIPLPRRPEPARGAERFAHGTGAAELRKSTEQFYMKVPVALAVSGRYHEFAKFFYNISRLERAINMEDIRVQRGRPTGRR